MRKLMALSMALMMLFVLSGCFRDDGGDSQKSGSVSNSAGSLSAGDTEKKKEEGLSLDEVVGTYTIITYYEGKEQQHTAVFSKNGNNLIADSDAKGEEAFELSYDPSSATAKRVQEIPHEDDLVVIESNYIFSLKDGKVTVNGNTIMSFKEETREGPRYEGYKND